MKKFLLGTFMTMLILVGIVLSTQGKALALTFDLNYIMEWEADDVKNEPAPSSFGTITFTELTGLSAGDIEINVILFDPDHKIQSVYWNYDDLSFTSDSTFQTASPVGISNSQDSLMADGYSGRFDLSIPSTGNLGSVGSYSDTISLTGGSLSDADFNFTDTSEFYLAAVHIGSFGDDGEDSIWVGAAVPIPPTILLFGWGLIGLAVVRRKKIR